MRKSRQNNKSLKRIVTMIVLSLLFCNDFMADTKESMSAMIENTEKIVALTFDDGPKSKVLEKILPLLKASDVKATFFVNGFRVKSGNNCQVIGEMAKEGHSIQNHTYGHGNFKIVERKYGRQWILRDIEKNASLIESCTGKRPTFLRPPFWVVWNDLERDIRQHGHEVLTLREDINSQDYEWAIKDENRKKILPNVLKRIKDREKQGKFSHVLVFHEIGGTVEMLPGLISELKKKGYVLVTIEDLYSRRIK